MSDSKNKGRLLELHFFQKVSQLSFITNILTEIDLTRKFGYAAASVDFLLELDHGVIMVQTKYRNTRRRENISISKFLNSVEYISKQIEKPVLFGVWVSRLEPFDDNKEWLSQHKIVTISQFHSSTDQLSSSAIACIHDIITEILKPITPEEYHESSVQMVV